MFLLTFLLQLLLNHRNTNVNIEGRNKYTPLHLAAHLEHKNAFGICQKLVKPAENLYKCSFYKLRVGRFSQRHLPSLCCDVLFLMTVAAEAENYRESTSENH